MKLEEGETNPKRNLWGGVRGGAVGWLTAWYLYF